MILCNRIAWIVSDLVFPFTYLIPAQIVIRNWFMLRQSIFLYKIIYEPPRGKTNNLHRRIAENKDADQLRGNSKEKQISAFVFATQIVQFLFYLNPKCQASSSFLCLYRPVCVGPIRKPHCWFSHEAAHMITCWQLSEIVFGDL